MSTFGTPLIDQSTLKRIIGASILLMAVVGGAAYAHIHQELYTPGDPARTLVAVADNLDLITLAAMSWLFVALLDLVVSLGVFHLYRSTNDRLATFSARLRGTYAAILIFAAFFLLTSGLSNNANTAYLAFSQFEFVWGVGLLIFGIHLFCLGYLARQSTFTPNVIGWLLMSAGVCYLISKGAWLAGLEFAASPILGSTMIIGELSFALWLIKKSA